MKYESEPQTACSQWKETRLLCTTHHSQYDNTVVSFFSMSWHSGRGAAEGYNREERERKKNTGRDGAEDIYTVSTFSAAQSNISVNSKNGLKSRSKALLALCTHLIIIFLFNQLLILWRISITSSKSLGRHFQRAVLSTNSTKPKHIHLIIMWNLMRLITIITLI